MFAIDLIFKNGQKFEGLVWSWRPEKGWFEALDESNGGVNRYMIKDIVEGKFYNDHIRRAKSTKCCDFLEKAREDGYPG